MNVLLVEDDDGVREVMVDLLMDSAQVRATNNVNEALKALAAETFQLVIADLRIRGVPEGGRQIIGAARKCLAPVLLMTGLQRDEMLRVLGDARPDAVLLKPFPIEDALALYQRFARLYREAEGVAPAAGTPSWKPFGPGLEIHVVEESASVSKRLLRVEVSGQREPRSFPVGQVAHVVEGSVTINGVVLPTGRSFFLAAELPYEIVSASGGVVALVGVGEPA